MNKTQERTGGGDAPREIHDYTIENSWFMKKQQSDNQERKDLLKAIVTDVDAMRHKSGDFGPFTVTEMEEEGSVIEWPNLSILIEKARKLL